MRVTFSKLGKLMTTALQLGSLGILAILAAGCASRLAATRSGAILQGQFDGAGPDTVKVGTLEAAVDGQQGFELWVPVERPSYQTLNCGRPVRLFLTPGDRLLIHVSKDGSARFSGRGSEVNTFLAEMDGLWQQHGPSLLNSYRTLVAQEEEAFVVAWDSSWKVLSDPLEEHLAGHKVPDLVARVERGRIRYAWAEGRVRYPFLHWREVGADSMQVSERYRAYVAKLELNDRDLLPIEEYTSFLNAFIHEEARAALRQEPSLQSGDNRWTRAKYAVAMRVLNDEAVWNHVLHTILSEHLDRYGSKGLEELLGRFQKDCSDDELVREVREAYQKDRGYWEGYDTEVYKTVDGVGLDAHVLRPEGHKAEDRRPALVWFHGGSWAEGAWYRCLGLCGPFVSKGMVVIQVEYRIHDRHGSTPLESIADAKSAIRWVRMNAGRLGVDPARVVAAGFSSGGHLAASAGTLDGLNEPGENLSVSARPDAMVLFGACVNPTLDPWYVQVVRAHVNPEDGSPAHHVQPGLPPTMIIHGTRDRMCPFPSVLGFADAMKAAGNTCQVEAFEGRPHFFLWQNREDRADALQRVFDFLLSQGLLGSGR